MKYILHIAICIYCLMPNIANGQCIEKSHSPFEDQGWFSCQKSLSVIPERGEQHWILYDFNQAYELLDLSIWNHNVWGQTGAGVKSILIDYSIDQVDWQTLGPIEINKAPGSWKYTINESIDLNEINARYMLITAIDTWDENSDCAGFGELRIAVNQIVSTDEPLANTQFNIYPNPAADFISMDLSAISDIVQIELCNAVGQVLNASPTSNNDVMEIGLDNLDSGVYLVIVTTESGKLSQSFVKI